MREGSRTETTLVPPPIVRGSTSTSAPEDRVLGPQFGTPTAEDIAEYRRKAASGEELTDYEMEALEKAGLEEAGVKSDNPIGDKYLDIQKQNIANGLATRKQNIANGLAAQEQIRAKYRTPAAPVVPMDKRDPWFGGGGPAQAPVVPMDKRDPWYGGGGPTGNAEADATPFGPTTPPSPDEGQGQKPPKEEEDPGLSFVQAQDRAAAFGAREEGKTAAQLAQRQEGRFQQDRTDEATYRAYYAKLVADKAKLPMTTLFEDMNGPRRMLAGVALAVGGFSAGFNGGPNQAFEIMKTASDMDWKQKMDKLDSKVKDMELAGANASQLRAFSDQAMQHAVSSREAQDIHTLAKIKTMLAPYPQQLAAATLAQAKLATEHEGEKAKLLLPYTSNEHTDTNKGQVQTVTTGKGRAEGAGGKDIDELSRSREERERADELDKLIRNDK